MSGSQANFTLQDFVRDINRGLDEIYLGTSIVSVVFVTFVIISFAFIPRTRKHPAQLLFNRTMLDLVICLTHIVSYVGVVERNDPFQGVDSVNKKCQPLSFFYQVALFGSNTWYFMLSIDLYLAVRNPFSCNAEYTPYYYATVYISSIVSGLILVTGNYGLTIFNYCWVSDGLRQQDANLSTTDGHRLLTTSTNWVWGVYYGPHLIMCLVSLFVVIFTTIALHRGLPASSETRRRVVRFGFYYVIAFAIEWAVRLILYLVQVLHLLPTALRNPNSSYYRNQLHNVAVAFAVIEGLRGVVDFVLWFSTGTLSTKEIRLRISHAWAKWTGRDTEDSGQLLKERLLESAQTLEVSSVLRHDMIICTSWGIIDSAPVNMRPPNLSVTGFENSLRAEKKLLTTRPEVTEAEADINGASGYAEDREMNALEKQLEGFSAQKSELQLWLRSTEGVRTRRIHCPTALQSTSFDFRDYAPEVFSCVRSLSGIDPITYCESFNISKSRGNNAMLEKFTEGRSGSFFYFTHDSRYIVKTVNSNERELLHTHVRDYFFHLHSNPDSFLARFFGLHAMRLSPEQQFINVTVMENIFPSIDYLRPTERYDLKGSWVARRALKGKNLNVPRGKLTLKDNDLKRKIRVGPDARERILAQLRRDVGFLSSIGIMDYSVLVGIRDFDHDPREEIPLLQQKDQGTPTRRTMSRQPQPAQSRSLGYMPPSPLGSCAEPTRPSSPFNLLPTASINPTAATSPSDGSDSAEVPWHRSFYGGLLGMAPEISTLQDSSVTESAAHETTGEQRIGPTIPPEDKVWSVYYIGLIDILQRYNVSKKLEHFFKSNVRCMDGRGISAVNVNDYADRFIRSMEEIFV